MYVYLIIDGNAIVFSIGLFLCYRQVYGLIVRRKAHPFRVSRHLSIILCNVLLF